MKTNIHHYVFMLESYIVNLPFWGFLVEQQLYNYGILSPKHCFFYSFIK